VYNDQENIYRVILSLEAPKLLSINNYFIEIRRQTLLEDLWTIWSCCLYVLYEYYYHNNFYQCIYGFIPV